MFYSGFKIKFRIYFILILVLYFPIREFYNLEGLWVEAPRVEIDEDIVKGEN